MANYFATTRSNYFRVTHAAEFEAWCTKRDLTFWTKSSEGEEIFYAVSADTGDCGGWPSHDCEADDDFDIASELAAHLAPRDIAILFEVGSEKLRYLSGYATAIHPDGRTVTVSLTDIYEQAKEHFGPAMTITEGEY